MVIMITKEFVGKECISKTCIARTEHGKDVPCSHNGDTKYCVGCAVFAGKSGLPILVN